MPATNRLHAVPAKVKPPLSKEAMYRLTKKLIAKNRARGYSAKRFQGAVDKDWMSPRVRRTMEFVVERKIFDNRFDSRRAIKGILENVDAAIGPTGDEAAARPKVASILRMYLAKRWMAESKRGVHVDVVASIRELRKVFEQIDERSHAIAEEVRAIDKARFGEGPGSVDDAEMRHYYKLNTRDAFAHMAMHHLSDSHIARYAIEVLKDLETGRM